MGQRGAMEKQKQNGGDNLTGGCVGTAWPGYAHPLLRTAHLVAASRGGVVLESEGHLVLAGRWR